MLHWSLPPARVKSLFYTEFVLYRVFTAVQSFRSRTAIVALNPLEHETLVELFTLYFHYFIFCKQVSLAFQSVVSHVMTYVLCQLLFASYPR